VLPQVGAHVGAHVGSQVGPHGPQSHEDDKVAPPSGVVLAPLAVRSATSTFVMDGRCHCSFVADDSAVLGCWSIGRVYWRAHPHGKGQL